MWAYYIQKRPYDQEAMEYLTRHHMHLTPDGWGALTEQAREEAVARKLWIPENHRVCWALAAAATLMILCSPGDACMRQTSLQGNRRKNLALQTLIVVTCSGECTAMSTSWVQAYTEEQLKLEELKGRRYASRRR